MTREEAIRELKADYCGNRIICELYPDQCNREECEIWLAIKALETQPDGDVISRQSTIETVKDADVCVCYSENESVEIENVVDLAIRATKRSVIASIEQMPSAQPEQDREFIKLTVRNSNGRPYYSIIYLEFDDNGVGHDLEGYSSYSLDVISDYLKKYFMPSAQPEITPDGTLNISITADVAKVGRILLSQTGTQRGGLYYKDAQPEIIHCAECKWLQCNMRQDGTLPKGVDEFECRHWCGYCDPVDFCSHAERRTDG